MAIALTSKVVMPQFVQNGMVYFNTVGIFAYADAAHLAILSSAFHYWWAITYASTLESRIRYTPSDVFETFAQPAMTGHLDAVGEELDALRRPLMLDRQLGLTALYNLVHNPTVHDTDIRRLRDLHVQIDLAAADAYGWSDLPLDHGFHETRQGMRFTVSGAARTELLDRLLDLNHQRHAEEEARGLTGKTRRKGKRDHNAHQPELLEA